MALVLAKRVYSTANPAAVFFPSPTAQIYFAWLAFQAVLAVFFPGPDGWGQVTPAGHKLKYKVNGMCLCPSEYLA